jgi:hypothetical protein
MSAYPIATDSGYSPPLTVSLELHGQRFDIAEIGPEFVRVRGAVPVAEGVAKVHFELDGQLTISEVDLFDGIDPQRKRQPCKIRMPLVAPAARPLAAAV